MAYPAESHPAMGGRAHRAMLAGGVDRGAGACGGGQVGGGPARILIPHLALQCQRIGMAQPRAHRAIYILQRHIHTGQIIFLKMCGLFMVKPALLKAV